MSDKERPSTPPAAFPMGSYVRQIAHCIYSAHVRLFIDRKFCDIHEAAGRRSAQSHKEADKEARCFRTADGQLGQSDIIKSSNAGTSSRHREQVHEIAELLQASSFSIQPDMRSAQHPLLLPVRPRVVLAY